MRFDRLRGVLLPFAACAAACAAWSTPHAAERPALRPERPAVVARAPALPERTAEQLAAPSARPAAAVPSAPVDANLDEPDSLDDAVVSWLHERVRRGHAR